MLCTLSPEPEKQKSYGSLSSVEGFHIPCHLLFQVLCKEQEMTRNPSSSTYINRNMEVEELKLQDPQFSGAYIRSLVKQLSSSRSKDPVESKEFSQDRTKDNIGDSRRLSTSPSMKSSQPKKVRRRLHTTRPYQERLLNMAEARREIVTALKHHRATMKQANEQQMQQQQQQQQWDKHQRQELKNHSSTLELSPLLLEDLQKDLNDYRRHSRIYPPDSSFPNYIQSTNLSPYAYHSLHWMYPPISPLPVTENLNITLPNQPLGLNLNLQSFSNSENFMSHNLNGRPSNQPSSPPTSYSSSSPTSIMSNTGVPCISQSCCRASGDGFDSASVPLYPVMDEDEIAKIRSIGEQHDMEWNDRVNLMTSAWWSNFLKNIEEAHLEEEEFQMFEDVMSMPSRLHDGGDSREPSYFQQHSNSYYNEEDYLHDAAFPW